MISIDDEVLIIFYSTYLFIKAKLKCNMMQSNINKTHKHSSFKQIVFNRLLLTSKVKELLQNHWSV